MSRFVFAPLLLFFLSMLNNSSAANILLVPFPWKSHVMIFKTLAETMLERGHRVTMVMTPTYPEQKDFQDVQFDMEYHATPDPDWFTKPKKDQFDKLVRMSQLDLYFNSDDDLTPFCSNLLSDNELVKRLKAKTFDIAVVGSVPFSRCFVILPYRLGIPYISMTVTFEPWLTRLPVLPSVYPFQYAQFHTERMDFAERLRNTWLLLKWMALSRHVRYLSDDFLSRFVPDKPYVPLMTLLHRSEFWLIEHDILMDYPRPLMPNEILVGGVMTQPARPLPDDIKQFMDSAPDGVIVVSFGAFDGMPPKFLQTLLDGFLATPYHVLWRTTHADVLKDVPERVKILRWIPQNDILGHKNTKLFITHCGNNGQYEALYNAVPMLGIPLYVDQHFNARRTAYHGYGRFIDLLTFTSDDLAQNIRDVIGNRTYYDKIGKASEIYRNRPDTPRDRAVDSVEYALRFGTSHLRSYALDMPWYEYLMLDILAAAAASLLLVVMVTICLLRACVRQCKGHRKIKQH